MSARILVAVGLAASLSCAATAARAGAQFEIGDKTKIEVGFFAQGWYQFVEHGAANGEGLHDFMARRAYLSVKAEVTPYIELFTHIASDRLGQEGLDNPSLGLGSGVAFRDLWITVKVAEAFKVQIGRMYVPLTRGFGTTGAKAQLTTDFPFLQGGVRGTIFYTSKAGRDDGLAVWGNPWDGRFQYRLMIAEGLEGASNPGDSLRLVGRVAFNLLEPEKGWFNQGTYLGTKKVLSLGLGFDSQHDLTLAGVADRNNRILTADIFFDHPVKEGAVTFEAAYSDIENSAQSHNFSDLRAGDDGATWYLQAGYLLPGKIGPGRLQPYARFERIDVTDKGATTFPSAGVNYFIKGHNAKISLDYTFVDPSGDRPGQSLVTFQITAGF